MALSSGTRATPRAGLRERIGRVGLRERLGRVGLRERRGRVGLRERLGGWRRRLARVQELVRHACEARIEFEAVVAFDVLVRLPQAAALTRAPGDLRPSICIVVYTTRSESNFEKS